MLAGKWISKMFDAETNRCKVIQEEKLRYEYLCDLDFEKFVKLIQCYFSSYFNDVSYISENEGKVCLFFIFF